MADPVSDRVAVAEHRGGARILSALLMLLVLTSLSWGLAHVPLGPANQVIALVIAGLKASVVAYVFMELDHASVSQRVIGIITFFYIALICLGLTADVGLR